MQLGGEEQEGSVTPTAQGQGRGQGCLVPAPAVALGTLCSQGQAGMTGGASPGIMD